MTADDLPTCARLLSMIAIKLGHDWLQLRPEFEPSRKCASAVFGHYSNFDTILLKANDKGISVKYIDAEGSLRSNADMYTELVSLLYKTLESGGKLSDGKSEVDASAVPEFMVECSLNGVACHGC